MDEDPEMSFPRKVVTALSLTELKEHLDNFLRSRVRLLGMLAQELAQ